MIAEMFSLPAHYMEVLDKRGIFTQEMSNGSWITVTKSVDEQTFQPVYRFLVGEQPYEPKIEEQVWTKEGPAFPGPTRTELNGTGTQATTRKVTTLGDMDNNEDAFMSAALKLFAEKDTYSVIIQKTIQEHSFMPGLALLVRKYGA